MYIYIYIESCPLSNDTAICALQISPRISQHPGAPHCHRLWHLWPTSARHFSEDAAGHQVSPSRGYVQMSTSGWFKPIIGQKDPRGWLWKPNWLQWLKITYTNLPGNLFEVTRLWGQWWYVIRWGRFAICFLFVSSILGMLQWLGRLWSKKETRTPTLMVPSRLFLR